MKRILVFTCIAILIVLAGAGMVSKSMKSVPNDDPTWFNVQAADLRLWVANNGLYGGWYQDNTKGLLFHLATPRDPDYHTAPFALHSNPTNDGGYYGNGWNQWSAMPAGVPIPLGTTPSVSFYAHWNIEPDADCIKLEIAKSDDNYTYWECLQPTGSRACPSFVDNGAGWIYDGIEGDYGIWFNHTSTIPAAYAGKTVKLRFRLRTDDTNVSTGFFVDDFALLSNGNPLATYSFSSPTGPDMWVTNGYWGVTAQSLWTENLLFQGEVIAGVSTSYVANVMASDWQPFGADYGPPLHLRQTTRWTAPANQPKFDLDTYFYAPSGSGGGRYIIADCYLKLVNDVAVSNLYLGLHMEPRVSIPIFDETRYDPTNKMIWLEYDGHEELTCMGIMYLEPNNGDPRAARVCNMFQPFWGDDTNLYNYMAVQQYDTSIYQGKSFAIISEGPFSNASFQPQPVCGVVRFTFAFVAADGSSELFDNALHCRQWYDANLADNPQYPVKIAPTSLGNIKALYK